MTSAIVFLLSTLILRGLKGYRAQLTADTNVNTNAEPDELLAFCKKYSTKGTNIPLFPGIDKLRQDLANYMNKRISIAIQKFVHTFNDVQADLLEERRVEITRLEKVMEMTYHGHGESVREVQKPVEALVQCIVLKCKEKIKAAKHTINANNIDQLRDIWTQTYQILKNVATVSFTSLGDLMGYDNCLSVLETMEHCCVSRFSVFHSRWRPEHPAFDGSGKAKNRCTDGKAVEMVLRRLAYDLEIQLNALCI